MLDVPWVAPALSPENAAAVCAAVIVVAAVKVNPLKVSVWVGVSPANTTLSTSVAAGVAVTPAAGATAADSLTETLVVSKPPLTVIAPMFVVMLGADWVALTLTFTVEPPLTESAPPVRLSPPAPVPLRFCVTVTTPVGLVTPPITTVPLVPVPEAVVLRAISVPPSMVDATVPWAVSIAVTAPVAPLSATPPAVTTVWVDPPTRLTLPAVSTTVTAWPAPALRKSAPAERLTLTDVNPVNPVDVSNGVASDVPTAPAD